MTVFFSLTGGWPCACFMALWRRPPMAKLVIWYRRIALKSPIIQLSCAMRNCQSQDVEAMNKYDIKQIQLNNTSSILSHKFFSIRRRWTYDYVNIASDEKLSYAAGWKIDAAKKWFLEIYGVQSNTNWGSLNSIVRKEIKKDGLPTRQWRWCCQSCS